MEEIDLREVAKTFWKKKFHILIILAIFVIVGVIYTYNFVTPKYTAKTTLILASINRTTSTTSDNGYTDTSVIDKDISLSSKLVSTYRELIRSKNVLAQVIENLDIDISEESLKKMISVDAVGDTALIEISVENKSAELACYVANETANIFKEYIKGIYDVENVQIIDVAEIETEPSNVHHKRDIAIFGLIGIVVSAGYVLILNMLDTTVKSIEDVEEMTGLPVLASLPTLESFEKTTSSKKSKIDLKNVGARVKSKEKKKGGNKHE
ncbi:MAG: hypothetical protein IJ867_06645 [Clostridia bacterium]|nr:hypothetical protein [Clostridia bacterium]